VKRRALPGVSDEPVPPAIVFDSRKVIRRARRRAAFRDVVDLLILAFVDALFVQWPDARIPTLGREASLLVLAIVNLLMFATMWLSRAVPRWRARRVATTWTAAERRRVLKLRSR
jgi:hypothetical protein